MPGAAHSCSVAALTLAAVASSSAAIWPSRAIGGKWLRYVHHTRDASSRSASVRHARRRRDAAAARIGALHGTERALAEDALHPLVELGGDAAGAEAVTSSSRVLAVLDSSLRLSLSVP